MSNTRGFSCGEGICLLSLILGDCPYMNNSPLTPALSRWRGSWLVAAPRLPCWPWSLVRKHWGHPQTQANVTFLGGRWTRIACRDNNTSLTNGDQDGEVRSCGVSRKPVAPIPDPSRLVSHWPFSDARANPVSMSENGETQGSADGYIAFMKIDTETCYRALAARDARFDGLFFVGGDDDANLLPAHLLGTDAGQRPLPVLRQRRGGGARGVPPVPAVPARAGAGACPGRRTGTDRAAGRGTHRGRGAQRRRQPGDAGPRARPELATAPPRDPAGIRRLTGRARSNPPAAPGQATADRDEPAHDRGCPGQRLRQPPPVQRTLSIALLHDALADPPHCRRPQRPGQPDPDPCLQAAARMEADPSVPDRQSHAGCRVGSW